MQADRWKQIEELYHAALAEPPEKRADFILRACTDPSVRDEVQSLVQAESRGSLFLERQPPAELAAEPTPGSETAGTTIGRYLLLENIGEGGMGEVWLAEQQEPVRRLVALKLVKSGMNTREVMTRFESERQALALMDHPAIARVFDAGSTARGAPYFVMEYFPGVPITVYCSRHRLDLLARLELFIQVCEGVQHAHQKAIIHRDLKPSNILVTEIDGRAVPKIIDFGVAKALTQKLTSDTMYTRAGVLVGTPEYMSPEQAGSSGEDIDTRTDTYSLGIVFYELLAGVPPLDLRRIAFEEFLRRLREEEPPKPSGRVRAQNQALAKQLRGDLDSIALKALEKDRARRYVSPLDFATDIRRYLRHDTVLAVRASTSYRLGKFARRHRAGLAAAAVSALFLILAAGVSLWQSVRATRQRDRADAEAAVAQAVNDFLQNDLLAQAGASKQAVSGGKPDPDLRVRTALDRAAVRIQGKFDKQPEVEAAIRQTIAETYMDLGLYPEARKQLERAMVLERSSFGTDSPKTLRTAYFLATAAWFQGNYAEAEPLMRGALAVQRRVLGPDHRDTLASTVGLAAVYALQGKYAQAEPLSRQALDISRRIRGPEHPQTLTSMHSLTDLYLREGKYAQAEALGRQTVEIKRRVLGADHPETLMSMGSLAAVYAAEGKYPQAEALFSQLLEANRRMQGPEHPYTLAAMNNLAAACYQQGKYSLAEALFSQAVEIVGRKLGAEHPNTLMYVNNLADVFTAEGKYPQAEALYGQAVEKGRRALGAKNPEFLYFLSDFGSMYQRQGKYAVAESYAQQSLTGRRQTLGPNHPDTMDSAADLVLAYLAQGKYAHSEPLAREILELNRKMRPGGWQLFRAETLLGASLAGQKKYSEAEPLLVDGYQGMEARKDLIAVPDRYHLERAHEWLIQIHQVWGKPDNP